MNRAIEWPSRQILTKFYPYQVDPGDLLFTSKAFVQAWRGLQLLEIVDEIFWSGSEDYFDDSYQSLAVEPILAIFEQDQRLVQQRQQECGETIPGKYGNLKKSRQPQIYYRPNDHLFYQTSAGTLFGVVACVDGIQATYLPAVGDRHDLQMPSVYQLTTEFADWQTTPMVFQFIPDSQVNEIPGQHLDRLCLRWTVFGAAELMNARLVYNQRHKSQLSWRYLNRLKLHQLTQLPPPEAIPIYVNPISRHSFLVMAFV